MRAPKAIDAYFRDMQAQDRINSDRTVRRYRVILHAHAEDIANADPAWTTREDVKRTLQRWAGCKGSTKANARAILVSFYRWTVEEGIRPDNPAAATQPVRKGKPLVYRMTREEIVRMMTATQGTREKRAIYLGICAGLRLAEMCALRGEHLQRPGWVWVSEDIAKGRRERWVPVVPDLVPIVTEIRAHVAPDHYVLPLVRPRGVWGGLDDMRRGQPANTWVDVHSRPSGHGAIYNLVRRVAERARVSGRVTPHTLRHAFGDHIAKGTGLLVAQALMGHASVETTRSTYVGRSSLDELAAAVEQVTFNGPFEVTGALPRATTPEPAPAGSQ